MRVLLYFKLFLALVIVSCVQPPEPENNASGSVSESDIGKSLDQLQGNPHAIILSEGLWGLNNSDIAILDENNNILSKSYFAESLKKYLGDTASDILYHEGKLYIAVTISNKIIQLDINTNTLSDIIFLPNEFRAPRAMAISEDNLYITDQFEDKVIVIDISGNQMQLKNSFSTGPAPEDIIIMDNKLFVANSGYGDFRANEEKAGYLTTYSKDGIPLSEFLIGENLVNLEKNEDYIIAGYLNTPENLKSGESGGVKIINPLDMSIIDSVQLDYQRMTLDEEDNILYVLTTSGVLEINLSSSLNSGTQIISNNTNDIWYEIEYDHNSKSLYISNAANHQTDGEVLIYSTSSYSLIGSLPTGINPSDIIFLEN